VIDVRDERSVTDAVAFAVEGGTIDSVVYAAGITASGDVRALASDVWRAVLSVNLDGAFLCARAFTDHLLRAERPASLAFLASTAGLRGEAGAAAYCASKFGLVGLVRCLALEVAKHRLRVNAVCPGDVDSAMLASVAAAQGVRAGRTAQELLREYADAVPRGRLIEPLEVGRLTAWLATPAASGLSGVSLPVDGGALAA
jgi:NAD(P)-dependent dehydrogenase (short-subunit alcohol dehydrogenase family)